MTNNTVSITADSGLCCSCGICKNICPCSCISWKKQNGMFMPEIDDDKCVKCGMCTRVCPGLGHKYSDDSDGLQAMCGEYLAVYNAWSKNSDIRHVSASGGVVSTLIISLLNSNTYDVAFSLDSYNYDNQLKTVPITSENIKHGIENSSMPKSRYLPVSHENLISFLKENPQKRVIIIGVSCAMRGIANVIENFKLKRDQYLLIGLFCDKVFNYNVYDYFKKSFSNGRQLTALHFKNKESGGWPGNMKFMFSDGSYDYQLKKEREKVKDYFMPERCLYCIDKVNVNADISLGDNYTDKYSSELGSNSVIIRTSIGEMAWQIASDCIEYYSIKMHDIVKAQYFSGRIVNLYYSDLKCIELKERTGLSLDLNQGVKREKLSSDFNKHWKRNLEKLNSGKAYLNDPNVLKLQIKKAIRLNKKKRFVSSTRQLLGNIKRKLLNS